MRIEDLPFTIPSLRAAYGRGLSPAAVIAECHRRLAEAADPGIFLHLVPLAAALAEAAALGPFTADAPPLWGIPFAIKDNIDLADSPTTAACPAFAQTPTMDAFVVGRLRAAGALPIGKTNLDQFATGLVGTRTPYPVPRNPLNPALIPGGSSSGSAVAVARGLVAFALGSDTAGSGRVPAALNNIVGLKPSPGLLSTTGLLPACRSLDTISIFALTIADAQVVLTAAAAFDPADPWSRRFPPGPAAPASPRIGIPSASSRRFHGDAAQSAAFDAALRSLAALGAELVPLDFAPFHDVASLLYEGAWLAERHAAIEPFLRAHPEALLPVTHDIIARGGAFTAVQLFRDLYRLKALSREIDALIDPLDMLCVPTIPGVPTLADIAADPIGPNERLGTYTNFVNLLDLCGLAVPTAPRSDGLPFGVTLLARAGRDLSLAPIASQLHATAARLGATGWPNR